MPSRQTAHGGGSFASEDQREYLWATRPRAAHAIAHNRTPSRADWQPMTRAEANAYKRALEQDPERHASVGTERPPEPQDSGTEPRFGALLKSMVEPTPPPRKFKPVRRKSGLLN